MSTRLKPHFQPQILRSNWKLSFAFRASSQRVGASNGSHILQYDTAPGSTEESALYGSAEEIIARLGELHAAGVTQVLINSGGVRPIESLRRFARRVMPAMVEA